MSDVIEQLRTLVRGDKDRWFDNAWYDGDVYGDFEVVDVIDEGDRRWVRGETVIVEHTPTGDYYAFSQDIGLTEEQEASVYPDDIWPAIKRVKVVETVEWVKA